MKFIFCSFTLGLLTMVSCLSARAAETAMTAGAGGVNFSYALIMSSGHLPGDQDVMIVAKRGNLLSFKYCRAFTSLPVESVLKIRQEFFLNPAFFQNPQNLQPRLRSLYKSPDCQTIGSETYSMNPHAQALDRKAARLNAMSTAFYTAVGTVVATTFLYDYVRDLKQGLLIQNTETVLRYIFSADTPHGMIAITLGIVGSVGTAYLHLEQRLEKESSGDSLSASSYERFTSGETVVVEQPMSDFVRNFSSGLKIIVEGNLLTSL
jgi:hypothetical protein